MSKMPHEGLVKQVLLAKLRGKRPRGCPTPRWSCFFSLKHFVHFFLRHFDHWDIPVICLTVVLKLVLKVFISLYFQTFWPKWLNFFGHFKKISVYDRKQNQWGGVTSSHTLLGPVLVWREQNYLNCCWPWGIPTPPRAVSPATFLRRKAGMKMNEMNAIHVISFIHQCLKVLSKRVNKFLGRMEMIFL